LLKGQQSEEEASSIWRNFMKSMDNPADFEEFVGSLKEIKSEKKV
jgi:hypothetical protein